MAIKVRNKEVIKSQHYQKCQKANRPGADFPALCRDRIFQPSAPGGFKGTQMGLGDLQSARAEMRTSGRKCSHCTEGKNHFARPPRESFRLNLRGAKVMLPFMSVLCTGSPKSGARPVIISKISSLKLSPGRLWRLGGFQRLDTSSVF